MAEENIYTTENLQEEKQNTESIEPIEEKSEDKGNFFPESSNEKEQEPIKTVYVKYVPYGLTPETYEERCEIKKAALAIGFSFLAMFCMVALFNLAIITTAHLFDAKIFQFLSEPAVIQVQQIVFSLFSFITSFVFVFKIFSFRISDLVSFKLPEKKATLTLFLFGIAFCAFSNIASNLASHIFTFFNVESNVSYPENPKGFFGFLLSLISTVAVPALVEEFACRGLLLGVLRKFGDAFAIVTSAILFGVMHGNFEQIPFAFMVGLVLGFVTVKSGSIWIAVAIHAFNNFISVFCDYALSSLSPQENNVFLIIIFSVCMLFGIIALLFNNKKDTEIYELDASKTVCTEKQKYKWFFTSATVIIYVVICTIEAIAFLFS